ncbi:Peroxisomal 2,4-dienoyl-CoA reductase [Manis javanica]|nr:Peroxisomal 2,4-dienoyl-CoA reductase [Manis javanica]
MAQPPPGVEEDDCLLECRHLFCPHLPRDKVAFITGGGSGTGLRIAEVFMRLPGSWPLPLASAAVDQGLKEFGKIDILVNCVAGHFLCPASMLSFNAFKTVMDIDALGLGCFTRFFRVRVLWAGLPLLSLPAHRLLCVLQDHGGVMMR